MFLDAETLLNDGDECVGLCMFEFNFSDQSTHDCRQTCGASATDKMNRSLACDGVKVLRHANPAWRAMLLPRGHSGDWRRAARDGRS